MNTNLFDPHRDFENTLEQFQRDRQELVPGDEGSREKMIRELHRDSRSREQDEEDQGHLRAVRHVDSFKGLREARFDEGGERTLEDLKAETQKRRERMVAALERGCRAPCGTRKDNLDQARQEAALARASSTRSAIDAALNGGGTW